MQKTNMLWKKDLPASVGFGLGISVVVTFLGVSLCALFVINGYFKPQSMIHMSIIIQFISSFVGSVISGKIAKDNKLVASVFVATSYFFTLIAVAMLLFDGVFGALIPGLFACLIGCGAAILLCNKAKTHPKRTRRRRGAR